LRIKWEKRFVSGERKGDANPQHVLATLRVMSVPIVDLDGDTVAASLSVPIDHSDPFDELLLIHAQQLQMRLLTRDEKLAGHPLALTA
jgi:PIN domain nuclease of toxin-antitoxin system